MQVRKVTPDGLNRVVVTISAETPDDLMSVAATNLALEAAKKEAQLSTPALHSASGVYPESLANIDGGESVSPDKLAQTRTKCFLREFICMSAP